MLNTIVAEAIDELRRARDGVEGRASEGGPRATPSSRTRCAPILQRSYAANKQIVFGGDNYSEEWHAEAERAGCSTSARRPTRCRTCRPTRRWTLFANYGVLSRRELESRYEVFLEQYVTKLNIEAETAASIARTMLLPAAARHLALLLEAQLGELACGDLGSDRRVHRRDQGARVGQPGREPAARMLEAHAEYMRDTVIPAMARVREAADRLEKVVADDLWPLPKYSEILFIK